MDKDNPERGNAMRERFEQLLERFAPANIQHQAGDGPARMPTFGRLIGSDAVLAGTGVRWA